MLLEKFLKDPRYASLKSLMILLVVVVLGSIVISESKARPNKFRGLIIPEDTITININLQSVESGETVESGIYGIHMAKLLDEAGVAEDWLSYVEDFAGEIEADNARFFAGGEVSYYHFKTTYIDPSRLSPQEISALVNGNEIRGNGFIIKDREDAEANGNEGELSELTGIKPRYGNMSYLEGFQGVQPRNFIRDYVDILDAGNSDSLFVLNMRYSSPNEELEKINFLIDEGINISGIECGNEAYAKTHPWHHNGNPVVNAPISVEEYLDTCDSYRSVIQGEHPNIPFAVSAAPKKSFEEGADWEDSDFNTEWNNSLSQKMIEHGYENYVVHFYAPFTSCEDEISSGDRDSIFNCGIEEMRDLKINEEGPYGTTHFPAMLAWYNENFPGSNMWVTEWNINQDPVNGTNAKFANSILHAAFVTNVMNMMNEANEEYGNFITFANLHTFMTDGGNAMVNLKTSKGAGNAEPDDMGDFVRRTPYFAYLSMKNIFKDGYKPLNESFSTSDPFVNIDDITIHAYENNDGILALSISNLTGKTLSIGEITLDGEIIDNSQSEASLYSIDGDAVYSSRGKTEFAINPGHEVVIRDSDYESLDSLYFPMFGVGTIEINPEFISENNDCTFLENITGNCDENEDGEGVETLSQDDNWQWIVNGKDMHERINKNYEGTKKPLSVKIYTYPQEEPVGNIKKITEKNTDLDSLLGTGKYTIKFFDGDGLELPFKEETGAVIKID